MTAVATREPPSAHEATDVQSSGGHAEFASVGRTGNRSEIPPPPVFGLAPGHTRIGGNKDRHIVTGLVPDDTPCYGRQPGAVRRRTDR